MKSEKEMKACRRAADQEIDLQLKGERREPIAAKKPRVAPSLAPIPTRTSCDRRQSTHPITRQQQQANNKKATYSGVFWTSPKAKQRTRSITRRIALERTSIAARFFFEAGLRKDQQTRQAKMILRFCLKPRREL